jgi:hypothetical protein
MLAAPDDVVKIDEPGIGAHLGVPTESIIGLRPTSGETFRLNDVRAEARDYFFARQWENAWRAPLRELLLARLGAQLGNARFAILKEPNGSLGADAIMSVLPESRLIFLLRDGRDVVDSELDAAEPDSWATRKYDSLERTERGDYLRGRAHAWVQRTEVVQRAFAAHDPELRYLVRYEALRADPESVVSELARWLDLPVAVLTEAARATAFERLPENLRGQGQFARAASPGLWRENLLPDEQAALEQIMGPKLRELDY